MPTRATSTDHLNGIYKELGELSADVRTIKHSQNNTSMKLDAIGGLLTTVEALVEAKADHEHRINTLEDAEQRRKGVVGLLEWLSRHWPFAIVVAGAMVAWTWLHGRPGP